MNPAQNATAGLFASTAVIIGIFVAVRRKQQLPGVVGFALLFGAGGYILGNSIKNFVASS